jgi:hypothetical protein
MKESLLNTAFNNSSAIFLGLTFIFLLPPITFAPTDCLSHSSLIPIQRSKNENSKNDVLWIINHFSSIFIYKKRDERETEREIREREIEEIKIEI